MLWICAWILAVAPAPTPTMAITAATPMMMPSIVNPERVRFTFSARRAIRIPVISFVMPTTMMMVAMSMTLAQVRNRRDA